MLQRLIPSVASIAMAVAVSSSPSFAFTLSSPALTEPVIKAEGVQQVWYHYWWHYHYHYWHHWHHWH